MQCEAHAVKWADVCSDLASIVFRPNLKYNQLLIRNEWEDGNYTRNSKYSNKVCLNISFCRLANTPSLYSEGPGFESR
jgi:hypothetical protein